MPGRYAVRAGGSFKSDRRNGLVRMWGRSYLPLDSLVQDGSLCKPALRIPISSIHSLVSNPLQSFNSRYAAGWAAFKQQCAGVYTYFREAVELSTGPSNHASKLLVRPLSSIKKSILFHWHVRIRQPSVRWSGRRTRSTAVVARRCSQRSFGVSKIQTESKQW